MPDEPPEAPSVWDDLDPFSSTTSEQDIDWDAVIGEPPEWYFPLVGQVAVATAGLERQLARVALHVLGWPPDRGGDLTFWLSSSARLRTLLTAAQGVLPDFDALAAQMETVWKHRNEVVHVSTGWHDWEGPDEPSGWHYDHPRSGERVYLSDPETRPKLERLLARITDLDQRAWDLHRSLIESSAGSG